MTLQILPLSPLDTTEDQDDTVEVDTTTCTIINSDYDTSSVLYKSTLDDDNKIVDTTSDTHIQDMLQLVEQVQTIDSDDILSKTIIEADTDKHEDDISIHNILKFVEDFTDSKDLSGT